VLYYDTNISKIHAAFIFWVVTPYSVVVGYQISEGVPASIFRVEMEASSIM
jgi:hypothetical protein